MAPMIRRAGQCDQPASIRPPQHSPTTGRVTQVYCYCRRHRELTEQMRPSWPLNPPHPSRFPTSAGGCRRTSNGRIPTGSISTGGLDGKSGCHRALAFAPIGGKMPGSVETAVQRQRNATKPQPALHLRGLDRNRFRCPIFARDLGSCPAPGRRSPHPGSPRWSGGPWPRALLPARPVMTCQNH
jgi:hypothetical protein